MNYWRPSFVKIISSCAKKKQQQKQTNKQKTPLSDADVPEEENGG